MAPSVSEVQAEAFGSAEWAFELGTCVSGRAPTISKPVQLMKLDGQLGRVAHAS
jgi:hypothetical protein